MSISLGSFSQSKYDIPEQSFLHKVDSYSRDNCSIAFSLKLINKDYTGPLVKVRRISDAAISDFYGDDSGNLFLNKKGDNLTSWLNGSIGYVPTWYDQSGNARHITQYTEAFQPSITESGGLLFNGSTQFLQTTNTPIPAGLDTYTYACTFTSNTTVQTQIVMEQNPTISNPSQRAALLLINNQFGFNGYSNDAHNVLTFASDIQRKVVMICNHSLNQGNITLIDNGTIYTATTANPPALNIGAGFFSIAKGVPNNGEYFSGTIKEVIVFNNNLETSEAILYYSARGEIQKTSSVQPKLRLKGWTKSNYSVPTDWVFQFDTQQLTGKGLANGTVVSSIFEATATSGNEPTYYNPSYGFYTICKTLPGFLHFENTTNFLTTSTKTFNISTNGGFTAVFYFAFTKSALNGERVIDFSASTSNPDYNILIVRSGTNTGLIFEIYNGATFIGNVTTPNGVCNTDQFSAWACRYTDSTKLYEIFKDGILIASNTGTIFATNRTLANCRISASADGTYNSRMNMCGLYTYDRSLDMTEIAAISNHLMDCDSPDTNIEIDSNAVFNGSILAQGWNDGGSMRFNGLSESFIDIQDVPCLPLSISSDFYCTNVNTTGALMTTTDVTRSDYGVEVLFNGSGGCYALARLPTTAVSSTIIAVSNNTWYNIAVVVDLDFTVKFYMNGSLVGSAITGTALPSLSNRILIGTNYSGTRGMNGYIHDFQLFDYALSANQVNDLSNKTPLRRIKKSTQKQLVTRTNWYTEMTLTNVSGYVPTVLGVDPYVQYKILNSGSTFTRNIFSQQIAIQDFESFQCTWQFWNSTTSADYVAFFCGTASSSTDGGGYVIYFDVYNPTEVTLRGTTGTIIKKSYTTYFKSDALWNTVVISYKRGTVGTWTVNLNDQEILVYDDPNNETFRTTTGGDWWGISCFTGSLTMNAYIRGVELEYTPYENISVSKGLPEFTQTSLPILPLSSSSTTISGSGPFNGIYELNASSVLSGYPSIAASFSGVDFSGNSSGSWHSGYAYNSSTGAYTGAVSTTSSGIAYSGEWIQIKVPNAIQLSKFDLTAKTSVYQRMPVDFVMSGSNDASTWTSLYIHSGKTWSYSELATFKCNLSSDRFLYFRLICQRLSSGNGSLVNIGNIALFPGVSMGYSFKKDVGYTDIRLPLVPLTQNNETLSGKTYYHGDYVASASSDSGGYLAYRSLSSLNTNVGWHSNGNVYNTSTGIYQGAVSTTSSSTNYLGEWLQLKIPNAINLVYFDLHSRSTSTLESRMPVDFIVAGSMDGVNWITLHSEIGFTWSTSQNSSFTCNQIGASGYFKYFRLVAIKSGINNVYGGINITNWSLFPKVISVSLPIVPLTGNTQTLSGTNYYHGNYVASASSVSGGYLAYISFSSLNNDIGWHSGATYISSTGIYQGAISTTSSSEIYSGEWLQLEIPNAINLVYFDVHSRSNSNTQYRMPVDFIVAGSIDGVNWITLHSEIGFTWSTSQKSSFTCNQIGASGYFKYFRLVAMKSAGDTLINIENWYLIPENFVDAKPSLIPGLTWKNYNESNFTYPDIADNNFYSDNTPIQIGTCLDTSSLKTITNDKQGNLSEVFSMEIFGYFKANVSGNWTMSSGPIVDDGISFWIGNNALVGYTNANANFVGYGGVSGSVSVYLSEGIFYPIRIQYTNAGVTGVLQFTFTPPGGASTSNGDGYYFSSNGLNEAYPAESAKIIKDTTGVNEDGVYYILCNGISTPVYCLMNDVYDGGGWMSLLKATQGTTFQYSSTHWTTASTLNPTDTTRIDADAKYDSFNYCKVKDVMAIWPDISPDSGVNIHGRNGGSFYVKDGWVWLLNNWTNTSTRLTGLVGFNDGGRRVGGELGDFLATSGANNPKNFTGYSSTIWSSMTSFNASIHFIAGIATFGIRWGFYWNNESNYDTCDAVGGIGIGRSGGLSAGDVNNGYDSVSGINRQARVELYGR
jgi:hypothetical protein